MHKKESLHSNFPHPNALLCKKHLTMQIVTINKSDTTGGAAVAASRLVEALQKIDINTHFLVEEKLGNSPQTQQTNSKPWSKYANLLHFLWERLYFLPHEADKSVRFAFSPAIAGQNIAQHPTLKTADLLHFHWFNQGFVSLSQLEKIFTTKRPVVWTLHDMWAFTGGCHYAHQCTNYSQNCGNCPMLKTPSNNDLSAKIHTRKQFISRHPKLTIVTCSNWLAEQARASSILQGVRVVAIPNPIDSEHFAPKEQQAVRTKLKLPRNKKIILFGAANVDDSRKGFKYLKESLLKLNSKEYHLLIFGKAKDESLLQLPCIHTHIPYANHQLIVELYNAANLMVLPSLQDNLPNTIMESLACGTPVVAFSTGGIPEMIRHQTTGYLCSPKDSDQLTQGISYTLQNEQRMRSAARQFVLENYSQEVVAKKYLHEYERLLQSTSD